MDLSIAPDLHQAWSEERDRMIAEHDRECARLDDLLEEEKQKLRAASQDNLQKVKTTVPRALYKDVILPMAEKALSHDIQEAEASHRKWTEHMEKRHREERACHEISYLEKLKVKMATTGQSSTATRGDLPSQRVVSVAEDSGTARHQDVSDGPSGSDGDWQAVSSNSPASQNPIQPPSLTCTVQHENDVNGERRLMMRIQKRKAATPVPKTGPLAKRLRVDTSVNPPPTPVTTPPTESAQPSERTMTFDEVYQDGNAAYKDVIVEWPARSDKWWILKCEQHNLHFARNPVQGAAKHLNGIETHGFPNRNRAVALRTLGFRIIDCTEALARLNNEAVEKAYANGYVPGKKIRSKQESVASSSMPRTPKPHPAQTVAPEGHPSQDTPLSHKSYNPWKGITHPKTFRIYYGQWKASNRIYPIMILGWDDQTEGGLKGDLYGTGLLKKTSQPPGCYIYEQNKKISGWAPGYEDDGPKVRSRKFPVMFFDELQSVGWLPARDLTKFPLYKRKAPVGPDHPFNAARRWIAEREGFKTWAAREESRRSAMASLEGSGKEKSTTTNADTSTDSDGADDSDSGSGAKSSASTDTEKMMNEWREKGGEITDDDDYSASGSDIFGKGSDDKDIDDNLDCEVEDWNRVNGTADRPWTFYPLRKTKDAVVDSVDGSDLPESAAAGMESARKLAEQVFSPGDYSHMTGTADARKAHDEPTSGAAESQKQKNDMIEGTRDAAESEKLENRSDPQANHNPLSQRLERALDMSRRTSNHATGTISEDISPRKDPEPGVQELASTPTPLLTRNTAASEPATLPTNGTATSASAALPTRDATTSAPTTLPTGSASVSNADFEFSLHHASGSIAWERSDEGESCMQLYRGADGKTMATRGGPLDVRVDPMDMLGFSREPITGSGCNSALALKHRDGSTSKFVFDRSKGSKLDSGKVQARSFIRWLRSVNPDIQCLEA